MPKIDLKQLEQIGISAANHIREMLMFKRNYRFENEFVKQHFKIDQ